MTRDGFAIAIHLIQKKLAGQDIPYELPPSLMPPSAHVGTSHFSPANAQSHQEPEPATDQFSFDDTPSSSCSALPQQPPDNFGGVLKQSTGSRAESDFSALRVEKAEIEGAFLRDKEEARELHKHMIETGKQAEVLKADVERLKLEAMRQKGLLAIARKQLGTKESEKAKAEREHAEAVEELSSITRDKDTVNAELAIMTSLKPKVAQRTLSSDSLTSSSHPIRTTPDLSALPPFKSNNPFERLAMSSLLLQRRLPSPFSIQGSAPAPPSLSSTNDSDSSLTHSKERFSSLDKLPDSIPTNAMDSSPPKHPSTADVYTNLVAQLKELDIENSDSDGDSNDETILAALLLAASNSKRPTKSAPPSQGIDTNSSARASAPTSAFDDIFGPDNGDEVQTHLPTTGMSKMPACVTPANFSFDPGFDENFDFASASKTLEALKIPTTTGPSTPFYLLPPDKDRTYGTFDVVFGDFESRPVSKVEDKPIVESPPVLYRSDKSPIPGSFPQTSFPTPPVRSPQPHPSFSSSLIDNHDKPKEPQARIKLSVSPI